MSAVKPATIFALSSGRPPAAIAVIRISGPRAGAALEALGVKVPPPRQAKLARMRDPRSGEIIDEALALWFPGPNSETGEDVAELQAHGGPAVIAAILDALGQIDDLRMAEPGEFTRRGFENGKLDLTAVEGLADLVAAETEGQRRQAFRQMKGLLGDRADTWRKRLIQALALVEARIDFSDEADVPEDLVGPALAIVQELRDEIGTALADGGRGERLREGLVVAIAGPPNAGKSTLLNRLAQRDVAIVSPYAGTTRDVIEVHLDLGGYPMTLLDTAGIRETSDPVEMEGVARARARAAAADLVLWLADATAPGDAEPDSGLTSGRQVPVWWVTTKIDLLTPAAAALLRSKEMQQSGGDGRMLRSMAVSDESGAAAAAAGRVEQLPVGSGHLPADAAGTPESWSSGPTGTGHGDKAMPRAKEAPVVVGSGGPHRNELGNTPRNDHDSAPGSVAYKNEQTIINCAERRFILSAEVGAGVDLLLKALFQFAERQLAGAEQALVTRQRHRQSLAAVQHILSGVLSRFGRTTAQSSEELLAEDLRRASVELGRLTGRVDVEDILDVIFRDFCIGK
ncbi:MAG: tRNA uridine-5-carboxymethylaminomethyl(34) synthesis GTPase MnmE [Proteobacteria bacterium]|nr:tRNA uridine-5-carboxymethylaminomethyl(34) synthesis GTPase MnmE [Pseudomonadota bacterium]